MNSPKPLNLKKCKVCHEQFAPYNSIQPTCGKYECQVAFAIAHAKRTAIRRARQERKETRAAKEKLKTRSDYMKEAQIAVNRYVRARDMSKPCISCGVSYAGNAFGGLWDCGHYRSVGSNPATRFHLHNMAKQCVKCNRNLSGNAVEFRKGLLQRIGAERLAALEADNKPRKFDIEYLKRIKRIFNAKARRLERRHA